MITQKRLRQVFHYNPATGVFTRLITLGREKAGAVARYRRQDGYASIQIDRERCYAHRLAWLYVHGKMPFQIDHKDGNPANNKLSNLRESTQSQNIGNRKLLSRNKLGLKGVVKRPWNRYQAQIYYLGVYRHLGYFATAEKAHRAYLKAAKKLFGKFARAA